MKAMKAPHHPDPTEGLWLGMLFCAPLWAAILLFALR